MVTPVVLALTSMATPMPVMGSPALFWLTLDWIDLVLVIEVSVPLRSWMPKVLEVPPAVLARIEPLLIRVLTVAPASIRMAVVVEAISLFEPPVIEPELTRVGAVVPAPKRSAVESAPKARATMVPSLRRPPAMSTVCPGLPPMTMPLAAAYFIV